MSTFSTVSLQLGCQFLAHLFSVLSQSGLKEISDNAYFLLIFFRLSANFKNRESVRLSTRT